MASSSCTVSEDHLLCSICLDVFTDPVSTPCGHNFCKTCLAEHWDNSNFCKCPLCNKIFVNRPDLSVNTFISETATRFRKSVKINAERAHKHVPILKEHTHIDPVENLENGICQKHERHLEMFCKDDQMCVCLLCTVTDHKTHNIIPVEEASDEMKAHVKKTQTEVQKMIQDRLEKTEEIKKSLELCKKGLEDETAGGVKVFTALISSVERKWSELLEVMEEKQKAAERQAEEFIQDLEQEITELKRRDTELEQLSHTEDHLHLLQVYPSQHSPSPTSRWVDVSLTAHSSMDILITFSQLKKTLNKKLDKEPQQQTVNWSMRNWMIILSILPVLAFILIFLMCGNVWRTLYAVDVTLDPDTAHPKLIIPDDGETIQKSFDSGLTVLEKEGFSSGRFYFEVQVSGKTRWDLGVVQESIHAEILTSSKYRYWTLSLRNHSYSYKFLGFLSPLYLKTNPQKVGVFVDYEEGLVSFYDVEASSLIYSYTDQFFTKKLYPYFSPG